MDNKLTLQQQKVLDFVTVFREKKGYPPSVREICTATGLKSTATVHGHLERLERKGYIRRDPSKPRAISIKDSAKRKKYRGTPVLGKVTAGIPIPAQEDIQEYIQLPQEFVKSEDTFILNVFGDSMIDAGIRSGDKIIVRPNISVTNGDIVVAMLPDDNTDDSCVTVKRFYNEGDRICLKPENQLMEPIYCTDCFILGKVVGLMRTY